MKKGITILICTFFLINSGIFIITYYSKLSLIKEHAEKKISQLTVRTHDKETVLLKISKKERSDIALYKEINDEEFYYLGNLYDLISKQDSHDTLYVYCFHDLDEEDFQKSVCSYFDAHKNHDRIFHINTVQASVLNFIKPQNFNLYPVRDESGIVPINSVNILKGYFTSSDPPPRFIS